MCSNVSKWQILAWRWSWMGWCTSSFTRKSRWWQWSWMGWWTSRLRMRLRRRSTRWYFSERETVYKLYIWRKISKLKPQPFSWTWTWTTPKTWICICKRKKTTKWMWKKRRGTTWTSRLRIKSTRWWMRRTSISPRGKLYLTGNSKRHNLFSIFKRTG